MKTLILGLAAAALTAVALPAAAQSWNGDYGYRSYNQGRYGFYDYPQFRGEIAHLRGEIREGQEDGWLNWNEARQANWRLQQIQRHEQQEFREHGWNLPGDDAADIRSDLDRLDHWIDQQRDQGDDDNNDGWRRRY